MKIRLAKITKYPYEEPEGFLVGFEVKVTEEEVLYADAMITIDEAAGKTEEEIVELAYCSLLESIKKRADLITRQVPE